MERVVIFFLTLQWLRTLPLSTATCDLTRGAVRASCEPVSDGHTSKVLATFCLQVQSPGQTGERTLGDLGNGDGKWR